MSMLPRVVGNHKSQGSEEIGELAGVSEGTWASEAMRIAA